MNERFTAGNGVEVDAWGADGGLRVGTMAELMFAIPDGWVTALREFFRHERDEELGRWRDPMSPEVVVTEIDHGRVHVYNEATRCYSEFDSAGPDRVHLLTRGDYGLNWPAIRYFAAHPVSKPWHGAKQNEIWVLTIDGCGEPEAYRFSQDTTCGDSAAFRPVNNPRRTFFNANAPTISGARRIFPEASDA